MDFHRNMTCSGELPTPQGEFRAIHESCQPEFKSISGQNPTITGSCSGSMDEFLSIEKTDGAIGLEWLSIFVEHCFSGTGNCDTPPSPHSQKPVSTPSSPTKPAVIQQKPNLELVIPGKARTKRKRATGFSTCWSQEPRETFNDPALDPPLLHQAYWLADSELLVQKPKEEQKHDIEEQEEQEKQGKEITGAGSTDGGNCQPRRCAHCMAQRTPQWRAGPLGPKTLCNACGVRFKSGRLLPEYRPAKSPSFVSFKHSNSHKKVMEMRMSIVSE